jgi:glycosyltransferase involved in cell wall biosynthesis
VRILALHNRYIQLGGEDKSFDAQVNLLRAHGDHVDTLLQDNARVAGVGARTVARSTVWSQQSYRRVRSALRAGRYDVLDVHNTFPLLSPAVYYAARAEGVPVVQTLHNYRLICPSATLFRNGRVCEDCVGKAVPWPGVVHACYRASRAGTAVVVAMLTAHRLLRTWSRMVTTYVAMTRFERAKLIQGGLPAAKIRVKPHFVHPDPGQGAHTGDFAVFVGRLAPDKGLDTLLAAIESLGPAFPLRIIGDGPLAGRVQQAAARLPHVRWLGQLSSDQVYANLGEARMLVFPSLWYETFGLVAIEAYARGTPVIGSNIGAIAEIVEDDRTGLLFQAGDAAELARQLARAWAQPSKRARLGREARRTYEERYTAEAAYRALQAIYRDALDGRLDQHAA